MTSKTTRTQSSSETPLHLDMLASIVTDSADVEMLRNSIAAWGVDSVLKIMASKFNRSPESALAILQTGKSPNAVDDSTRKAYNDLRNAADAWNAIVNASESLTSAGKTLVQLRFSINDLGEIDAPVKTNTTRDAVNDNRLTSVVHCVTESIKFKVSRDFGKTSKAGKYLAKHNWQAGTNYLVDSSLSRNAFGVLNDDDTWTVYESGAKYAESIGKKN